MEEEYNREEFIGSLEEAVRQKDAAASLGMELACRGIERLYFSGCGAPLHAMSIAKYWVERVARDLEVRLYLAAELIHQDPPKLGEGTVVILGSDSGTTPETVQAAEFLRGKPCATIGITQQADSPLAQAVDHALPYGASQQGYFARAIVQQALVGAMLKELEGWTLHDAAMRSLDAFPGALADAVEASQPRAAEEARTYRDDRILYVVGSGPCFSTAYVLAVCMLMEMQWMHSFPIRAAEFFHGPFEVVDETTPLILLLGEDPSRPEAERVVRFCRGITERLMIYDAADFTMRGMSHAVRPLVAPFVLQAALDPLAQELAVWHDHPLSTRRYMGKVEY